MVGTDVLGNAAGFALHHFGAADVVEQRGFTVVHVAHHGYHRRARQSLGLNGGFGVVQEGFRVVRSGGFADVAHFFHHNQCGFLVERLVDGHHHAHLHQGFHHFHALNCHFVCQIGHGNGFRHEHFVHHRLGRGLEGVLVRLQLELFLAFFTAAYAFVIATVVAFFAFAFGGTAARHIVVALLVAIAFFRAVASGSGIAGGEGSFFARCGTARGRLLLFGQFGFLLSLQFGCFAAGLALLFFFQQGLLVGTQGFGTAGFFVTHGLFGGANHFHRLRCWLRDLFFFRFAAAFRFGFGCRSVIRRGCFSSCRCSISFGSSSFCGRCFNHCCFDSF